MAQKAKGKLFYQVSKEAAVENSGIYGMGGAAGVVVCLFLALLLGDFLALSLDTILFAVVISVFLGFGAVAFLAWLIASGFKGVFPSPPSLLGKNEVSVGDESRQRPVVGKEEKGRSVDFVFPEFSPEKR